MEQRVSVITLGVADLDRSRRFYEDGLGWRRGNENPNVVFFQLAGAILALWSRTALAEDAGVNAGAGGFAGITLAHNCRSKDDVDDVLTAAKAAGAKITKPATDTFWGGYSGYFADPDGHLWEVAWNPHWSIDAEGQVSL